MEPERNKYLSTEEFIRLTGLPVRTLRRRLRSGEIPAVKSGNRLLIPASALPPEAMKVFIASRHIEGSDENPAGETPKITALTPGQCKEQGKRLLIVKSFLQMQQDIPRRKLIEFKKAHAKQYGISRRTIDNYLKLYEEGGAAALVPGWTSGVRKKAIDSELHRRIENKYLRPHGPSMRQVWEEECPEIPYRTFTEHINSSWTKGNQLWFFSELVDSSKGNRL